MDTNKQILEIGKLKDMKWKVSMAMSSNTCKSLHSPIVSMVITLADSAGKETQHNFEMTLMQFKSVYKEVQDMAASFSTV